jgi:hypothetical protein
MGTTFRDTSPLSNLRMGYEDLRGLSDSGQSLVEFPSGIPSTFQFQDPTASGMDQPARHPEYLLPNTLDHLLDLLLLQNLFLEKIHQVITEHQKLQIGPVPGIGMGDHFVHPKAVDPFLDKILTAGPLIIKPPNLLGTDQTIGEDNLIIKKLIESPKEAKLFLGRLPGLDLLANDHHPEPIATQGNRPFVDLHPLSDRPPIGQGSDRPLHPRLEGNSDIKLDLPPDQKGNKFGPKETAIRPQANLFEVTGQLLKDFFQKIPGLIRGVEVNGVRSCNITLLGIMAYLERPLKKQLADGMKPIFWETLKIYYVLFQTGHVKKGVSGSEWGQVLQYNIVRNHGVFGKTS